MTDSREAAHRGRSPNPRVCHDNPTAPSSSTPSCPSSATTSRPLPRLRRRTKVKIERAYRRVLEGASRIRSPRMSSFLLRSRQVMATDIETFPTSASRRRTRRVVIFEGGRSEPSTAGIPVASVRMGPTTPWAPSATFATLSSSLRCRDFAVWAPSRHSARPRHWRVALGLVA